MSEHPDIATVASLMGNPTRADMLMMLMDGTAHTATELAMEGGVAPSTASNHLAQLESGGLVTIVKQGRHRYFRITSPEVASAMEDLLIISPKMSRPRSGPNDERLRRARMCYDHLAGEAGVRLLENLREHKLITGDDGSLHLTPTGEAWCKRIGIDLNALRGIRRPLFRCCLDWSERRMHLAGSIGAALCSRLLDMGYVRREPDSRALAISPRGHRFLETLDLEDQ
ncbi:DNA-binding transcriptional ArsR family regulator [Natronospira proteinivora]|uniref:DNA-binding transcriptional ArsR family regulator n=1 Tax=Natronospira proteinivora TaxID=1807133 RepID=A0ABT1G7H3_9GAMM|nr:winged helix-turn-helix domain-containing protein [Natronospira proteinivora]MCP1727247.1 DNA-binding transcriptional ArsR family regulator [Natronospira proteinivora]